MRADEKVEVQKTSVKATGVQMKGRISHPSSPGKYMPMLEKVVASIEILQSKEKLVSK